jgi:hypothetical protein
VSVNLVSSPSRKFYQTLRGLGVVNAPDRLQVEMDVERLNNYFLTRLLLNGAGVFPVPRTQNKPGFLIATVSESAIYDAVMSIRSHVTGGDRMSIIKLLLSVLTHIFNHIFVSSKFPEKWKTSVVLPIPKIGSPAIFSDYRPISIFVCRNNLLTVF